MLSILSSAAYDLTSRLRAPYGLPGRSALKNLSVFANSLCSTPKTTNDCRGFTGRMLKKRQCFRTSLRVYDLYTSRHPLLAAVVLPRSNFVLHFVAGVLGVHRLLAFNPEPSTFDFRRAFRSS